MTAFSRGSGDAAGAAAGLMALAAAALLVTAMPAQAQAGDAQRDQCRAVGWALEDAEEIEMDLIDAHVAGMSDPPTAAQTQTLSEMNDLDDALYALAGYLNDHYGDAAMPSDETMDVLARTPVKDLIDMAKACEIK